MAWGEWKRERNEEEENLHFYGNSKVVLQNWRWALDEGRWCDDSCVGNQLEFCDCTWISPFSDYWIPPLPGNEHGSIMFAFPLVTTMPPVSTWSTMKTLHILIGWKGKVWRWQGSSAVTMPEGQVTPGGCPSTSDKLKPSCRSLCVWLLVREAHYPDQGST